MRRDPLGFVLKQVLGQTLPLPIVSVIGGYAWHSFITYFHDVAAPQCGFSRQDGVLYQYRVSSPMPGVVALNRVDRSEGEEWQPLWMAPTGSNYASPHPSGIARGSTFQLGRLPDQKWLQHISLDDSGVCIIRHLNDAVYTVHWACTLRAITTGISFYHYDLSWPSDTDKCLNNFRVFLLIAPAL